MLNTDMISGYVGNTQVEKIYLGADVIWPTESPIDYRSLPFTYELETPQTISGMFTVIMAYLFIPENTGITMSFYDVNGDLIRTDTVIGAGLYNGPVPQTPVDNVKKMEVIIPGELVVNQDLFDKRSYIQGNYKVYGNILSLAYGDNFTNYTSYPSWWTSNDVGFFNRECPIFKGDNTGLTDASNLILADNAPAKIYGGMFSGCTSLVATPALPATTLAQNCYQSMFTGCASLVNAPALPATTLADYCYDYMFAGCSSLTDSPVLPATQPAEGCYRRMFYGCPLTSITCNLLVDANFDYFTTNNWNSGAEQFGVFYKNPNSTWKTNSQVFADTYSQDSGVPDDWTVLDYNQ